MQPNEIHQCQCPDCLQTQDHPNKTLHRQLNLLFTQLDERQRRWVAAWESARLGHGGDRLVSLITGLHVQTIRRGRRELAESLQDQPIGRVRRPGAGRPSVEKKIPPWNPTCWPCWSTKPQATR